jgi:HPr kinase/phosphorylase
MQNNKPKISVGNFISKIKAEIQIELLAGAKGTESCNIVSARIQKLGLALAGFAHYIHPGRIQIVGQSEISYLFQLEPKKRIQVIRNLDLEKICCVLITKNLEPPPELIQIADEVGLPILRTPEVSSVAINIVSSFLLEALAPQKTLHGVLVGIYGIGVLILGESGIGKSECALDLITRGHNLISDDSVIIKRIGNKIEGSSPELTREHLEIRGLGIINIREIFGVSALGKEKKQIDLCIELKRWNLLEEVERLGLEMREEDIFGLKLPKFVLPVSSGRNLSTLMETAIRVHLLKISGFDAARELIDKHTKQLAASNEQSSVRNKTTTDD